MPKIFSFPRKSQLGMPRKEGRSWCACMYLFASCTCVSNNVRASLARNQRERGRQWGLCPSIPMWSHLINAGSKKGTLLEPTTSFDVDSIRQHGKNMEVESRWSWGGETSIFICSTFWPMIYVYSISSNKYVELFISMGMPKSFIFFHWTIYSQSLPSLSLHTVKHKPQENQAYPLINITVAICTASEHVSSQDPCPLVLQLSFLFYLSVPGKYHPSSLTLISCVYSMKRTPHG